MDRHCGTGESSVPHRPSHDFISNLCKPLVVFSTWSTKLVVEMLGVRMGGETPVSEEEIRVLLHQGARLGTIDKKNRK